MTPTAAQRVDQIEEQLTEIRGTIAGEVAAAVGVVAEKMQDSIATQLEASLEIITKRFAEDLTALSARLETKIVRERENQEVMVDRVHEGQLKFHEEIRASIEAIKGD